MNEDMNDDESVLSGIVHPRQHDDRDHNRNVHQNLENNQPPI